MNPIAARMDFLQAVDIFNRAFNPRNRADVNVVDLFRMTQSDLVLEQPLSTTTTQYNFPVLSNIQSQNAPQFNTEIRLSLQDSFVPTRLGIFFALPSGIADTTYKLYPYPSPFIFTTGFQQMNAFYNGKLSIMVNNDQLLKNWSLWRHWKSDQTQQTAAPGAGSPIDQYDGDEDGFVPMQPYVLLIGSQDIQINITLPVAPTTLDANARIILWFRGVLAQNSTVVN